MSTRSRGLTSLLLNSGKFPPMTLRVTPLNDTKAPVSQQIAPYPIKQFISYQYDSSIIIPVDSFSFTFSVVGDVPVYERLKDGDIVSLFANETQLATGIVDVVDIETDSDSGERVTISGRDLLGQFEDQTAVNEVSRPIWGNSLTPTAAVNALLPGTRINPNIIPQNAPKNGYLFATEPGESKLAALQRYCEPLNILFWMNPEGRMVLGRPNMSLDNLKGSLVLSQSARYSNVISIKVTRAATQIPNIIVPVWSGQETTTFRLSSNEFYPNTAERPSQLRQRGNVTSRATVVSTPSGSDPQGFSDINSLIVAGADANLQKVSKAAGSTILQAYAKREVARANMDEVKVQVVVAGHYNDTGSPYQIDTVYNIQYDRGSIDEKMYLYQVEYFMDESSGQRTRLNFCRLGTIVSDVGTSNGVNIL